METMIQPKITGYRQLSEADAKLINEIKEMGEQVRSLVTRVQHHIETDSGFDGRAHSQTTNPARWASLAQTNLQVGFMELVRAVAQPTTF